MDLALSTKAKIAAVTLTAATLIGGAFSANAQQMATASKPDFSTCDRVWANNPNAHSQCLIDTINAHTRQMQTESSQTRRETAELDRDGQCARDLKALREKDPTVLDRGRAILAGRPAAQFGVCNLLGALTRG